jgi:hypothetical protein
VLQRKRLWLTCARRGNTLSLPKDVPHWRTQRGRVAPLRIARGSWPGPGKVVTVSGEAPPIAPPSARQESRAFMPAGARPGKVPGTICKRAAQLETAEQEES